MQCYISESLKGLDFRGKYNLGPHINNYDTLVMFGMYRPEDLDTYYFHKGQVILVWQGMDAKNLSFEWISRLRSKKAKHYAISHWIKQSLDLYGIENELKPISATNLNLQCWPRGNSIYFYSSDLSEDSANYHGEYMIPEIKRKTGLNIIRTSHGIYNKEQLIEIYKSCFINIRLTEYDGCPNTNLEMGLMGRRSVFNGDMPHSIKWSNVDDICESIWNEFIHKDEDNRFISEDFTKFLNIQFP